MVAVVLRYILKESESMTSADWRHVWGAKTGALSGGWVEDSRINECHAGGNSSMRVAEVRNGKGEVGRGRL
jgi:hypothetical protein